VASPAPPREEPPPRLAAVAPPQAAPPAPLDSAKARRTLLRVSGDPPVYPREAIRSGIESGRVVALVTVDAQGNVADVDIVRSEPPLVFDRAARAALAAWKFKAEGDRYRGEVELRFNLKE
jgi:protein TonB